VGGCAYRELHGTLLLQDGIRPLWRYAVLVRKADSIQALTNAFDESGIPYVVTAERASTRRAEIIIYAPAAGLANPRR